MKKLLISIIFILLIDQLFISCRNEEREFKKAKEINTIQTYRDFIAQYPEGIFKKEAQDSVCNLSYQSACVNGSFTAFEKYINEYPESPKLGEAKNMIYQLLQKSDWICKMPDSVVAIYMRCHFKKTPFSDSIAKLVWDCIKTKSIQNYPPFIKSFDSNAYALKAQKYIEGIEWDEIDKNTIIITKGWDRNNCIYNWDCTGMKEHWDTHISGFDLNNKPYIFISLSKDSYIEYISHTKAKIFKMAVIPKEFRPDSLPSSCSGRTL